MAHSSALMIHGKSPIGILVSIISAPAFLDALHPLVCHFPASAFERSVTSVKRLIYLHQILLFPLLNILVLLSSPTVGLLGKIDRCFLYDPLIFTV